MSGIKPPIFSISSSNASSASTESSIRERRLLEDRGLACSTGVSSLSLLADVSMTRLTSFVILAGVLDSMFATKESSFSVLAPMSVSISALWIWGSKCGVFDSGDSCRFASFTAAEGGVWGRPSRGETSSWFAAVNHVNKPV